MSNFPREIKWEAKKVITFADIQFYTQNQLKSKKKVIIRASFCNFFFSAFDSFQNTQTPRNLVF